MVPQKRFRAVKRNKILFLFCGDLELPYHLTQERYNSISLNEEKGLSTVLTAKSFQIDMVVIIIHY